MDFGVAGCTFLVSKPCMLNKSSNLVLSNNPFISLFIANPLLRAKESIAFISPYNSWVTPALIKGLVSTIFSFVATATGVSIISDLLMLYNTKTTYYRRSPLGCFYFILKSSIYTWFFLKVICYL